jgi:hypothetical protein
LRQSRPKKTHQGKTVGMFVNAGAREMLLQGERQRCLTEPWPEIHATILRLGLALKAGSVQAALQPQSSGCS